MYSLTRGIRFSATVRLVVLVSQLSLGSISVSCASEAQVPASDSFWPAVNATSKPWAYWYWMGGAVDKPGLSRCLEQYRDAGLGGLHLVPVYGALGQEARYVPFLSPRWIDLLNHAGREVKRLRLGLDMTCGTGWPFGGPWVKPRDAASQYNLETVSVGEPSTGGVFIRPPKTSQAPQQLVVAIAYGPNREVVNVTERVDESGRLNWRATSAGWNVTALFQSPTNLPVERAAPGGEGLTIDYFSQAALMKYLENFDSAFMDLEKNQLRALYHDSYENWGQTWTPQLFEQFQTRRGYDLRAHLPQLAQSDRSDEACRVRADYRETMSDLICDEFTFPWAEWVHKKGMLVRNEGHGAPGNPLDLYDAADIPETEVYGTTWLDPLGLKPLPGVPEHDGGTPEVQMCKLATSVAHTSGKNLCASETCTWLGEHFKVPLEHMKSEVDFMFVMGVNHIFFHGAPYSPDDAGWPGWLWYAATNIGPYMPAWEHMPTLCGYIARCQSCLQSGKHDNDVLVYFPIYDLWASDEGSRDNLQYIVVHSTTIWLDKLLPGLAEVGRVLWTQGYSYDFVSDRQIASISVEDGALKTRGGRYKTLIIPACQRVPEATMQHVLRLVRDGATVVIHKSLPVDVPGLANLDSRREQLRQTVSELRGALAPNHGAFKHDRGKILLGDDLKQMLSLAGVRRETMVDLGLKFVRRRDDNGGWTYFIVNHSGKAIERYVPLAVSVRKALLLDPMTGTVGKARLKYTQDATRVLLNLQPRQTIFIQTKFKEDQAPDWKYLRDVRSETFSARWHVDFVAGGPILPKQQVVNVLSDWTGWQTDLQQLQAFSGKARYATEFELPQRDGAFWALDLGEVCHSARVRINGVEIATLIASPFRVDITRAVHPGRNRLEIEVINLPANRIADMDRRHVNWQKTFFVDIHYRPFDASEWAPTRSGLIGPVRLIEQSN